METQHGQHAVGGPVVDEEDDAFWIRNLAQIDRLGLGRGRSEHSVIQDIVDREGKRRAHKLRGLVQRVYANADIHGLALMDSLDGAMLREIAVSLLVEDESAHCCIVKVPLSVLLNHGFGAEPCPDGEGQIDTVIRWRVQNLCKMESGWYEFGDLVVDEMEDGHYNEGVQSLLMQFEAMHLVHTGSAPQSAPRAMATNQEHSEHGDHLRESKVHCFGQRLRTGDFMKSTKMYYQHQHFSTEQDQTEHLDTFKVHDAYFQRMRLHHFRCSTLQRSPSESPSLGVRYQESVLFELWEIRRYLDRFWAVQSVSTRISVAVRIVAKSMAFDDTVYITDNSLLISDVNGIQNVHCVPLLIDCPAPFAMVCDIGNMDAAALYEQQPLVLLRDIALHFTDSESGGRKRLELRFDAFSMIDGIADIGLRAEKRLFCYPLHSRRRSKGDMLTPEEFENTPWTACLSAMVAVQGEVEMVVMKDGFDPRCIECRKVSQRYIKAMQPMMGSTESVEGMACTACLREKGLIRLILKRDGALDVVAVPVVNVWYKDHVEGIKRAIQWKEDQHIDEVVALKERLKKLVNDGDGNEQRGLHQCVIEYVRTVEKKSRGAVDRVECFNCFQCVI